MTRQSVHHIGILILAVCIGHILAYTMLHIPRQSVMVMLMGLLFFYPIFRMPVLGVYAAFLLSPFIPFFRRLYYLVYARPSIDPLIMVGDLLLLLIFIAHFFDLRERLSQNKIIARYGKIILLYFTYCVARAFVFNFLPVTESVAKLKYYAPPVLFFIVGILYGGELRHLKRIWYCTLAIGIIGGLYGMYQLFYGFSEAEMRWFSSIEFTTLFIQNIPRPFSLFQAPVAYADYMQVAIIAVLMSVYWMKPKMKHLLLLLIPLFFYGALITSVRSSWIGLLATFPLWYLFLQIKTRKNRVIVFILCLLLYAANLFWKESFDSGLTLDSIFSVATKGLPDNQRIDLLVTKRTSAISSPFSEHSFLSRVALWKHILRLSTEPEMALLGRGLGTFNADSLYFSYLAEFGYPGLIFMIALLVLFITRGLAVVDREQDAHYATLAKGIVVFDCIFAFISITGTHIHYFPGDMYFWFFNGVLIHRYAMLASEREQPPADGGHHAAL